MTERPLARQGDILIIPTDQPRPDGLDRQARDRQGRLVLAEGEATGHAHAIADPDAELFGTELEDRFLEVLADGGVTLRHDEHAPILLPPGNYVVRRQREWTAGEVRRVAA